MITPKFYCASDYAGIDAENASFYYGYEHSICDKCHKKTPRGTEYCDKCEDADREWCFVATFNGMEIVIPHSKLKIEDDMFDVTSCLCKGIGWILTKYKLTL